MLYTYFALSLNYNQNAKETVKKDKHINNQIKSKRKHFELENETSQVGIKILTRPSTDFPLAYEKKLLKK